MIIEALYEDQHMLVVNKPAGLPVHGGPKGGDNVEDLIADRYDPRRRRPCLAHRLDRDTSGCLVLGKTKPALRRLNHLFETRQASKTYWAITHGTPAQAKGEINAPLAKRSNDPRSWWMEVRADGQDAVTRYEVLSSYDGYSLIACYPQTGRTHQIRVHLAHIGCPIVGDPYYGLFSSSSSGLTRGSQTFGTSPKVTETSFYPLLLHARRIILPFDKDMMVDVTAPPPPTFQDALKRYNLVLP